MCSSDLPDVVIVKNVCADTPVVGARLFNPTVEPAGQVAPICKPALELDVIFNQQCIIYVVLADNVTDKPVISV